MAEPNSLEEAKEMYSLYLSAEKAILGSQEYEIGGRRLTRADLRDTSASRLFWGNRVEQLSPGPSTFARISRAVPRG